MEEDLPYKLKPKESSLIIHMSNKIEFNLKNWRELAGHV